MFRSDKISSVNGPSLNGKFFTVLTVLTRYFIGIFPHVSVTFVFGQEAIIVIKMVEPTAPVVGPFLSNFIEKDPEGAVVATVHAEKSVFAFAVAVKALQSKKKQQEKCKK